MISINKYRALKKGASARGRKKDKKFEKVLKEKLKNSDLSKSDKDWILSWHRQGAMRRDIDRIDKAVAQSKERTKSRHKQRKVSKPKSKNPRLMRKTK
jgi:hypothetical protein